MTDLTQATAAELGKLYAKGKTSPTEVMKAVLKRAEAINPRLNALCVIDAEPALAAAKASEKRWMKEEPLSPLDGVPVSIKELVRVKGWPASMGSKLTDKTPAEADAPAVARLREAGAIVFAQSTSSEYGHKGVTDSPLHGITRNPWKMDRTPGGSSGGAGAAVAAGLGPIAIGTDGGGSIRLPSSFTGLVGLKATFGRIPAWPPSLTGELSNTGPMCRTVLDTALMMNAIAKPDLRDGWSLPADDVDYVKAIKGKLKKCRIAFILRMGDHPLDIEVAAMVTKAAKRFEAMGCTVEEAVPPTNYRETGRTFVVHWLSALQRLLQLYPADRHDQFDASLLAGAQAGLKYTLQDVVDAQVTRREATIAWNAFFEKYDLLLTPTLAVQPFEAGQNAPIGADGKPNQQWSPYTFQFNLSRHPAVSVPCGLSRDGLPVGLQIASGHYKDALVLRAAARYAEADPLEFPTLPETMK
ncbi:aspartyl-tRNA(Asn)/glutamyl-tRNA(Gln) amidotransferase subunit A [Enhydrobacter aerosaccus]|uniref:Indoleacetamide hydrolase n=1 Tax=Enhydrobacter aerosaccus TaxID=225324 RepID=A0A1T4T533_9HYPH|nr:amidase [Enhydrobacter aerosaccus]SKA35605.1 aspartyl-tRNA(Asn)/glutamyl-tRNA(Gln) amidotransferase subunit A [Enhydrobacter aerosaccus]